MATILRSNKVEHGNTRAACYVTFRGHDLGIEIHTWGLRLMLVWWNVCIDGEGVRKLKRKQND